MSVSWIAFHVTDRCQLDCQHCLRDPGQKPKDLPLALIENILDQGTTRYGTKHVALTGGEPTLHPEIEGIIDAIVARGLTWHMVTNGKRVPWLVPFLKEREGRARLLDALNLSCDGADEATHDAIRGAGSYREVMTAALVCHANDIPFTLNVTLNAQNEGQVEAFGLLGGQLGAAGVRFGLMQPTGTLHDESLRLTAQQWHRVTERLRALQGALRIQVMLAEGFPSSQPFHVCKAFTSEPLHVDVDGNLNLCCMHAGVPGEHGDVAGNLQEMSLMEAHGRLLDIIHDSQRRRLKILAEAPPDPWDEFPCNACMKQFGKPHWTDAGVNGPGAARPRWTGAWSLAHQQERPHGSQLHGGGGLRLPVLGSGR